MGLPRRVIGRKGQEAEEEMLPENIRQGKGTGLEQ